MFRSPSLRTTTPVIASHCSVIANAVKQSMQACSHGSPRPDGLAMTGVAVIASHHSVIASHHSVIANLLSVIANEVKQSMNPGLHGLPRRFVPRKDETTVRVPFAVSVPETGRAR